MDFSKTKLYPHVEDIDFFFALNTLEMPVFPSIYSVPPFQRLLLYLLEFSIDTLNRGLQFISEKPPINNIFKSSNPYNSIIGSVTRNWINSVFIFLEKLFSIKIDYSVCISQFFPRMFFVITYDKSRWFLEQIAFKKRQMHPTPKSYRPS